MKILKSNWPVLLFFVVLAVSKFSLITKGHFFDADEHRYLYAIWCWNDISHGQFAKALSCLFEVQGRPGFVFICLVPAAIQMLAVHFHLFSTNNLQSFDIPSFFNALVSLANSLIFYCILVLILADEYLALIGTVVYSLLVNSYVYIRHLFPYDYSLFFFLLALFLILKKEAVGSLKNSWLIFVGVLCAIGALIYPGYYSFGFIILIFVIFINGFDLKKGAFFSFGFALVIIGTEIVSELCQRSYLMECWVLSDTVKHGSFAEGLLFIYGYLCGVEGAIGYVLAAGFILYGLFMSKDKTQCSHLVIPAVLVCVLHALLGVVFHKMVFYGRSLHMYLPFLVLAVVRLLGFIAQEDLRKIAALGLLVIALGSFIPRAIAYEKLCYPADIYFKYHAFGNKILIENLQSYFDPNLKKQEVATKKMRLLMTTDHPLNFPSYSFENYPPDQRYLIKRKLFQIEVYEGSDASQEGVQENSLISLSYELVKFN